MKLFKAKEFIQLARLLEMLAMKSLLPANWLAIKRSTVGHPNELVSEEHRTGMNEFLSDGGFKFQVQRVNDDAVAHRPPGAWRS